MRSPVRAVARPAICIAVLGCAGAALLSASPILDLLPGSAHSRLSKGESIAELVDEPAADITIVAAARTRIDGERFVAGFRDVERLQKSRYSPLNGRFSAVPRVEDLSALRLDDDDLDDLRDCRPKRCGLKLAAPEIERIRASVDAAGKRWKEAAAEAFKIVLVERAARYQSTGLAGLLPYEDDRRPVEPRADVDRFLDVVRRQDLAPAAVLSALGNYPQQADGVESFLYWSKDTLGDTRPIISITHAVIATAPVADPPLAVMVQVYASHYLDASVSLTTLASAHGARQLVYLRLTSVDVFDGTFGGFIRRMVTRRVRAEGPGAINALRLKLEAPPR